MVNVIFTAVRQARGMRRLAVLLAVSLALAAPAAAQQGRLAPDAGGPVLRGAIAAPAPRAEDPILALIPAPPPVISRTAAGDDSGQCRLRCSRDYYFCLAGEDDQCPQRWSRCLSGCAG